MPKAKDEWLTQSDAATLKRMSIAAINELVRRGRLRSELRYGKRVVNRAEVIAYVPREKKIKAATKKKSAK